MYADIKLKLKNNLRIALSIVLPILSYVIVFFLLCLIFSGIVQLIVQLIVFALFCTYCIILLHKGKDITLILIFPIALSAFQNVWLGICANRLVQFNLQIYLIFNILFVFIVECFLIFKQKLSKKEFAIFIATVILVAYSVLLYLFYPTSIISWFAALRNIITPFIYILFGLMLSAKCNKNRFLNAVLVIGIIVVLFGLIEILIFPDVWVQLNIGVLWPMKGIEVHEITGLPMNFYSSESFFGQAYIQRMSSTFADPVNLGTFLVSIVFIAYYQKKYYLIPLVLLACVLTISKGALLGILIFMVVFAFFKDRKKRIFSAVMVAVVLIGIAFLIYSRFHSSGSVFAHLSGFFSSFISLVRYPLGVGCGRVGVLASLFGDTLNNGIYESGFGIIVGSLGIIGLFVYIMFFAVIVADAWRLENECKKILCYTLLFSIFVNLMFNEVAMSPNSCGIYFVLIGVLIKFTKRRRIISYELLDAPALI